MNYRYVIRSCFENNKEWLLFKSGICESEVTSDRQSYDISLVVKDLLKEMLKENNISTAKKLLTRITFLRKENEDKPINEQVKKYTFNEKLLPNLAQVNNNLFINWLKCVKFIYIFI